MAIAAGSPDSELAPAKVNLFLHVVGRRGDGYHLLDSLAVFASVADRITYLPAEALSLTINGPFAPSLAAEPGNLVLRAAHALAAEAGAHPSGALCLEKNIPVASGIGGGSADAAATLRLLCRVWRLSPDPAVLDRIASVLGADVPVCLHSRPKRMQGVGDILTRAPVMPRFGLVLVNPGVPLATVSVFRARRGDFSPEALLPDDWSTAKEMAAGLSRTANDLEAPAISLVPAIQDVLHAISVMPGCLLARMSGSGATCFGLFASPGEAETAAAGLTRSDWWSWGGSLAE